MPKIPDGWLDYKCIGERIDGTRFVAFKVPLNKRLTDDIRLDPETILRDIPNLGLIIDLTNTYRYYDPNYFLRKGVGYVKIMVPGQVLPVRCLVDEFIVAVRNFLESNKYNDKLIGVHCTHGVNRTGYFICYYMISQMNLRPTEALNRFALARGHNIEKIIYINALLKQEKLIRKNKTDKLQSKEKKTQKSATFKVNPQNWRQRLDKKSTKNCKKKIKGN